MSTIRVTGKELKAGDVIHTWGDGGWWRIETLTPYHGPHNSLGAIVIARGNATTIARLGMTIFADNDYEIEGIK